MNKEETKKLPDTPGVYLFYNSQNEIIYVGKATSLRDRVGSYFAPQGSREINRPIEEMIHEVENIKHITTDSVLEAVILEAIYIKKHQPKYNVLGKDDKSWNYIVITNEEYPKVETLRERELWGLSCRAKRICPPLAGRIFAGADPSVVSLPRDDKYIFGPYPGLKTREALKILRRLFYISTCEPRQKRPCLYYEMGQCLGVCTGEISAEDYNEKVVRPLVIFLRGEKKRLIIKLKKQMGEESKMEKFEEAGRLRNQLNALQRIQDIALMNKSFVEDKTLSPIVIPAQAGIRTNNQLDSRFFNRHSLSGGGHGNDRALRVEGYDISNLGSGDKVGSMVVFDEDGPVKSQYRKFKIKTVAGQSDVDCLAEVLERRLKHLEWPLPQVFLIDGGLPQVNRVKKILREKNILLPIVGIAKGHKRKKNEFFVVAEKNTDFTQWFGRHATFLIRVRDEAHRFAITFNRQQRKIV